MHRQLIAYHAVINRLLRNDISDKPRSGRPRTSDAGFGKYGGSCIMTVQNELFLIMKLWLVKTIESGSTEPLPGSAHVIVEDRPTADFYDTDEKHIIGRPCLQLKWGWGLECHNDVVYWLCSTNARAHWTPRTWTRGRRSDESRLLLHSAGGLTHVPISRGTAYAQRDILEHSICGWSGIV